MARPQTQNQIPAGSAQMPQTMIRRMISELTGSRQPQVDIIDALKEDHKPLKELIKTMTSEDATFAEKKAAFKKFAPALIAHAKPEEQTWYADMKRSRDLKVDGYEGDVEHQMADRLVAELKGTTNRALFMAKVKVLGEFVEQHIKEEEDEMLPEFRKNSTRDERVKLGAKYLKLRSAYLAH